MSASNSKFPRGLRVLITMAVLAVLIWLFAANTPFYFYSIGAAALITAAVIYLTYRTPSPAKPKTPKTKKELTAEPEEELALAEMESEILKPGDIAAKPAAAMNSNAKPAATPSSVEDKDGPPVPLIDDQSSLTLNEINTLVNAVWYRCENPYCKYTSFLGVHHIVEEKDGGSNKLDNLIVLCPYCHDLAHRGEIPEKEMRDWISNRAERWKFKPDWKYF
jgi:5-methylcytosine-specific restriction endonuclease McrA